MSTLLTETFGRRLRLGVVGGGPGSFIGQVHRGAALMHEHYTVVAGVVSSDPRRSEEAGRALGIPRAYGTVDELFEKEVQREDPIDVLAIMTPNDSHWELSRRALQAGFDVVCEKPLTNDPGQARDLVQRVRSSDRVFCVAYCYTGYPMVRQARAMVAEGLLGEIRMVQCEYVQGHLAVLSDAERAGRNWHTHPEIVGPSLILNDIGTHTYHLAAFVTGLLPGKVSADVTSIVPGRNAHDYGGMLLRYANGARGIFWVTQAAAGGVHGLHFRVFGDKGGLEWFQEQPNELHYRPLDAPAQILMRNGPGLHAAARRAGHIAIGHPEGYREAFANLYLDVAEVIAARQRGSKPDPLAIWYPGVEDGAQGVAFVQAALESSRREGRWQPIEAI